MDSRRSVRVGRGVAPNCTIFSMTDGKVSKSTDFQRFEQATSFVLISLRMWEAFAAHVAAYREGMAIEVLVPKGSDMTMLHEKVGKLFGKSVKFAEAD